MNDPNVRRRATAFRWGRFLAAGCDRSGCGMIADVPGRSREITDPRSVPRLLARRHRLWMPASPDAGRALCPDCEFELDSTGCCWGCEEERERELSAAYFAACAVHDSSSSRNADASL